MAKGCAVAYLAKTHLIWPARNSAVLAKINEVLQDAARGAIDRIIVRTVKALYVGAKRRRAVWLTVERSQYPTLQPREHKLVPREAIELGVRAIAWGNIFLVVVDHRRDDVRICW